MVSANISEEVRDIGAFGFAGGSDATGLILEIFSFSWNVFC